MTTYFREYTGPKKYSLKVICSHCKKEKEFIVHIDTFDRLKFFNDKNTILNIRCAFDEFPNYHDWCVGGKYEFAHSIPIILTNKKLGNIEEKELSLKDRYEIKKQLYYERTNAIKEKENEEFKDWLKEQNSIIYRIRKTGFDAKLDYCCEDCVSDDNVKHFEVCVKNKNEKDWHKSIPFIFGNENNEHYFLNYIILSSRLEQEKGVIDLTKIFDEINI